MAGTVVKFCETYSNSNLLALADEDGMLYVFNTLLSGPRALTASTEPQLFKYECIRIIGINILLVIIFL